MCKRLISSVLICAALSSVAQINTLDEFVVTSRRPLKDIGLTKTVLDSAALKDNIASSLADVLAFNSPIFVKNSGRATLSTVAFRGTGPGHTQVTWNGMRINNPMMGMTDFSTIPSYFVDAASLLHGAGSVTETGGGLGGLVRLGTIPDAAPGFNAQYIQGIGSFCTFDEFLRLTYADDHWVSSTRAVYSSSPNEFSYINHDKKENIYDDNHNIIGQYHPKEKNRSGSFKDFQLLQEVYYNTGHGDRIGLNAWYINSNRELPVTTTDYGNQNAFDNRQREQTVRAVASWGHFRNTWRTSTKAGYMYTHMAYDYKRETAPGIWAHMTHSRSRINTAYVQADGEYNPTEKWYFTANASVHRQWVHSVDRTVTTTDGDKAGVGYDRSRTEVSASASAKWQPTPRFGLSAVLREDIYGGKYSPIIPALFVDGILCQRYNIVARASISRNYRFPTLNDLYFLPGGNPDLKNESGFTYDAGLSGIIARAGTYSLDAGVTWFDSYIDNWIIWLPTTKGFFSPRNIKKVHSYGIEGKVNLGLKPAKDWYINVHGTYSWTPSINSGKAMSAADMSIGKQLPYVPRHSATLTGRLSWRTWSFMYQWCYYSKRYTMSSNEDAPGGSLPTYFISNASLGKTISLHPLDLQLKLNVNNLFDRDYQTVLSHPMPGINFEFFVGITPHW